MEHEDLRKMTINELRELAHKYEDLKGVHGMKKDVLVDILCDKMGIEKKHHLPKGIGRRAMKDKIKELKTRRAAALTAHDLKALKKVRVLLRRTKHNLRDLIERAEHGKVKPKEGAQPPAAS